MQFDWVMGLVGGLAIGISAAMLLLFNGRIAGISGILGQLVDRAWPYDWRERALFVLGLLAAPVLYALVVGLPELTVTANPLLIVAAGLLVGVGARMGSGCTSGHGVCGAARLSRRSIAAMITFMFTAIATVAVMSLI
jgi:uncharacterized membrane protein YedE/YeeE